MNDEIWAESPLRPCRPIVNTLKKKLQQKETQ
jgi:hypothetical protein